MLEKDDWKLALEDARHRHNAILGLIHAADNQALALMRLYMTLGSAAAAGAVSVFSLQPSVAVPVASALASAVGVLAYGAFKCFSVLDTASVNLPGRGAEFWLWAANERIERVEVFKNYLTTLSEKHRINNEVNDKQTASLRRAKLAGIFTPIAALIAGATAALAQYFLTSC